METRRVAKLKGAVDSGRLVGRSPGDRVAIGSDGEDCLGLRQLKLFDLDETNVFLLPENSSKA
jgi:hypothetical protein